MKNFLKVSTKGHYGLALMVCLAKNFRGVGFMSLKEIGGSENISEGYLEEIAAMLKKKKLVKSRKGKGGGYRLPKDPGSIGILNIIEALEGPLAIVECLGINKGLKCDNRKCVSKKIWHKVQSQLYKNLRNIKLGEFI